VQKERAMELAAAAAKPAINVAEGAVGVPGINFALKALDAFITLCEEYEVCHPSFAMSKFR